MSRHLPVAILLGATLSCSSLVADAPAARAGIDRFVPAGGSVTLPGSADREVDFWVWTVVSPPGSLDLKDANSPRAVFIPSVPGTYVLSLEVVDDGGWSEPDYVLITALPCDVDGDGYRATGRICRGHDCDDRNPSLNPGAEDICEDGIDQNCDGFDEECCPRDRDGDGYVSWLCPDGTDCNDNNDAVHPGAYDICDGIDNDCTGEDDGWDCPATKPCVNGACGCVPSDEICDDGIDQDCDGHDLRSDEDGDAHKKIECGGDDCDDTDPQVFPGAFERCGNGKDDDCAGDGDRPLDADGDGYPSPECRSVGVPLDCDDLDPTINPGAPDLCKDGIDQNCDGRDAVQDVDQDGHVAVACGGGDCDDHDPFVKPGAIEVCNGVDDDCNGAIDDLSLPERPCGPAAGAYSLRPNGAVANWLVLGPFPLVGACWDDITRLPGGDAAADPAPNQGAFGKPWTPYEIDPIGGGPSGVADLAAWFASSGAGARRGAYLFTELVVPAPAHYLLQLQASDAAELWIDGVLQAAPDSARSCNNGDVESAIVYLSAGAHRVLVRTGTDGGAWTVSLKVLTPRTTEPGEDRPATEVRVDHGAGPVLGACVPGRWICDPDTFEAMCVDFVGPMPETCLSPEDEDCDGVSPEPDEDADGIPGPGCSLPDYAGPADCDDRNRQVGPTRPELCDPDNIDENCDGVANDLPEATCGAGPELFVNEEGAIDEWLVFGPIDTPGLTTTAEIDDRDLLALLGGAPESSSRGYPGQVVGPFAWTPVQAKAGRTDGWVALAESLPGGDFDRTTMLAQATLWIPTEAAYKFRVSAAGAVRFLVDGGVVGETALASDIPLEVNRTLSPGPHRLLLKTTLLSPSDPGFGVRVLRGGMPALGLGVDLGRGVLRGACVPGRRTCTAGGWGTCVGALNAVPEKCNRLDDDCDGVLPPDEIDGDGDGLTRCEGDLDETG